MGYANVARANVHRSSKAHSDAFGAMFGENRRKFFSNTFADYRSSAGGIHAKSAAIKDAPFGIAHHDLLLRATNLDTDTGHGVKSTAKTSPLLRSIQLGDQPSLHR